MAVASHTLTFPLNVSGLDGSQCITQIQVTLNTDNAADAVLAVLQLLGDASRVINPATVNTVSATFV